VRNENEETNRSDEFYCYASSLRSSLFTQRAVIIFIANSLHHNNRSALGRGGFGSVYRSQNIVDGREYAIKKIRIDSSLILGIDGNIAEGSSDKALSAKLKKVLREVKILALLDHPNIVRYYTAWLERDEDFECDEEGKKVRTETIWLARELTARRKKLSPCYPFN